MDIFDKYDIVGTYFDELGALHIKFVEKGTTPPADAPTTSINYKFDNSGNLKGELA